MHSYAIMCNIILQKKAVCDNAGFKDMSCMQIKSRMLYDITAIYSKHDFRLLKCQFVYHVFVLCSYS